MSLARWALCALLLVLLAAPLSVDGLQATAYGGWPAIGFAIALLLAAGQERLRPTLLIRVRFRRKTRTPCSRNNSK